MTIEEIQQAVARGWAHTYNSNKVMDERLALAIADEVFKIDNSPNLGCATTLELIEELGARARGAASVWEVWPNYRTIDHL
jgi:hypothetical protein